MLGHFETGQMLAAVLLQRRAIASGARLKDDEGGNPLAHCRCGTPTMAAFLAAGWRGRTSSAFTEATFPPPVLIASLIRFLNISWPSASSIPSSPGISGRPQGPNSASASGFSRQEV